MAIEPDTQPDFSRKASQALELNGFAERRTNELWHTPDGVPYMTVSIDGDNNVLPMDHEPEQVAGSVHPARWPIAQNANGPVRDWLVNLWLEKRHAPIMSETLLQVERVLRAKAMKGKEHRLDTRLTWLNQCIYLDLMDEGWHVVEIDATDWRIVTAEYALRRGVRFRRPGQALPLPIPERGGSLDQLRPFFHLATDDDFQLIVGFILMALNPIPHIEQKGSQTILIPTGPQGSTKTTLSRVILSLVDPSRGELRSPAKDELDLMIHAMNSIILAYDNNEELNKWQSNAAARLSTGGAIGKRTLYTDLGETIVNARRPQIYNGIGDIASKPDLIERSIPIKLPLMDQKLRKTEEDFYRELDAAKPRILGLLLDLVSTALRNRDAIKREFKGQLPRMADFYAWGTAALGRPFRNAYSANIDEAILIALEASPVGLAILDLVANHRPGGFEGTATQWLTVLGDKAKPDTVRSRDWPKNPRAFSNKLAAIEPALLKAGIKIDRSRREHGAIKLIKASRIGSDETKPVDANSGRATAKFGTNRGPRLRTTGRRSVHPPYSGGRKVAPSLILVKKFGDGAGVDTVRLSEMLRLYVHPGRVDATELMARLDYPDRGSGVWPSLDGRN